jgi:thioredoxin-related protein
MTFKVNGVFIFVLLIKVLAPCVSQAEVFDDSEIKHIDYPEWFIESPFLELDEDLNRAVINGKQGLMVLFTTEGCSYCDMFIRKSLGDPEIIAMFRDHFDAVGLEMFSDAGMNAPDGTSTIVKDFAGSEGAGFTPTILFYDEQGKRLLRLVGYQAPERFKAIMGYMTGGHYKKETFRDYVTRQAGNSEALSSYVLTDDPLFSKPPYTLDRGRYRGQRPVIVLFEKANCAGCQTFHESVLASEDVRQLLKGFELVRMDAEDARTSVTTPAGERLTPSSWYSKEGLSSLPALLFFDENGIEVLRTDALVLEQRMTNSILFVLERAYDKGWSYQRFARSRALARQQAMQEEGSEKNSLE